MRKLYLTSYTFETENGERVKDYRLVVVTQHEIDKMSPQTKATRAGEDVASKKLIAFMAIEDPSVKIIDVGSSDAVDNVSFIKEETQHSFGLAYTSVNIPERYPNKKISDCVLIDLEGNRTEFIIGHYDFPNENWTETATGDNILVDENMRWMYLPLAKYDK